MKINPKQHITKKGVVKRNPPKTKYTLEQLKKMVVGSKDVQIYSELGLSVKNKAELIAGFRKACDIKENAFIAKMKREGRVEKDARDVSFWNSDAIDELTIESVDNTYNWSYLGYTDFTIKYVYDSLNDKHYGLLEPHLGGDARGNYGEGLLFEEYNKEDAVQKVLEMLLMTIQIQIKFRDGSIYKNYSEQHADIPYYANTDTSEFKGMAKQFATYLNKIPQGYDRDEHIINIVDYE